MLSISGIFSVTFSVVFAFVADVTTDEDRSAAYGLVSIVCISVCWHPCSMSQATDGGFCAELSMVQWALFVKIQEEILVGVGVCQIIRHGETHTSQVMALCLTWQARHKNIWGKTPDKNKTQKQRWKERDSTSKQSWWARSGSGGFPQQHYPLHQSLYHRNVFLTTLRVCLPHPGISHLCCQPGHQSGTGGLSPRLVQRDSRHLDRHCCGAAGRPFHHGGRAGVVAGKTAASQLGVGHLVGKSRSLWGECGQRETSLTWCNQAMPAHLL